MTSPAPSKAAAASPSAADKETHKPSNFLRQIIEKDLAEGTYASRHWGGSPGDAAHHAAGPSDPAKIRTRFPPEPNGYLHIGHAKSICLNFGLARDYGGVCHLRFDDTNPEKEDTEYVDSIKDAVKWLGFGWENGAESNLYQASDYFDFMYRAAEQLIEAGHAYVDEQTVEQMRINRGDFGHPGVDSPFRSRTAAENLARFHEMRDGKHEDGSMVLRARIDMASPNINLRDPAIYRIRRATHHNTGDKWCIYPMYTFAHPIEDALEQITHSLCTLEFEDQRPFYDWLLERLSETVTLSDGRVIGSLLSAPPPRQYEFARLNLTYVVTSKRKLAQLVYDHKVSGWDDPRMPTIVGLRRRGYTPEAIQLFAERIGVTKSDSWIDYSTLEGCLRETLDGSATRAMAVLDPVKLVLTNWDEVMGAGKLDDCSAPVNPHHPELGKRNFKIGKEVWIERTDYEETPPKGFFRLFPGNKVRLKYGHVIECLGATQDANGQVTEVQATLIPDTKSGTPGSDSVKVKGVITWVAVADGLSAEVRMYDRLFTEAQPDAGGKDFIESLNPNSLKVVQAFVEPSLARAKADDKFQFERHGYFVADRVDHAAVKPVFNLAVSLKDSWSAPSIATVNSSGETLIDIKELLKKISKAQNLQLIPEQDPAVSLISTQSRFVAPQLRITAKGSDRSPFVIIRAPGAVGKTALAKYIASEKCIPLWDLSKQILGDHVFIGTLTNVFGVKQVSSVVDLISQGSLPLVIDALDEAEVRSGSARLENVLREIANFVKDSNRHSIILLARTDTADYVHSVLSEFDSIRAEIPIYEIEFFDKNQSLSLIAKSIESSEINNRVLDELFKKIQNAIANGLGIADENPWKNDQFKSFMGYAPVLLAITSLIQQEKNPQLLIEQISRPDWISKSKGSKFLLELIMLLLKREQEKFVKAIKDSPEVRAQDLSLNWDHLYNWTEQMTRLAAQQFAGISNYGTPDVEDLPIEIRKQYDRGVENFFPQHPFLRGSQFASPAFRDFLLAWSLKSSDFSQDAENYLKSSSFVPTPTLFSLYSEMPGIGSVAHAGFLIDSFFAAERGLHADSQALLVQTSDEIVKLVIWVSKQDNRGDALSIKLEIKGRPLTLGSRIRNTSVISKINVLLGEPDRPLEINNIDIVAENISIAAKDINIRCKDGSDHVIFSANSVRSISQAITINCKQKNRFLIYSIETLHHPFRAFEFKPTGIVLRSEVKSVLDDIQRIVRWFRKDGKQEFARYKDLIDSIAIGGDDDRKKLLEFMIKKGLITIRGSHYVMTVEKANEFGLSWSSHASPLNQSLEAFINDYLKTIKSGNQKKAS